MGSEEWLRGQIVALLQVGCDLLQIAFAETHTTYGDGPVRFYEKDCRDIGETIGIRDGIGVGIDQSKKIDPVFFIELSRLARLVLRDSDYSDVCVTEAVVKALEKREGKLANGAGDLEEGEYRGATRQQILKRMFLGMQSS